MWRNRMIQDIAPGLKNIFLVIVDISGYTQFLQRHSDDLLRAEEIVGRLLLSVIRTASDPVVPYEVSGDAVSFYALDTGDPGIARRVWRQVREFCEAFRNEERRLLGGESCYDCADGDGLKLKAVVHHGQAAFTCLGESVKIAGPDIILAHRLLKNSIAEDEYVIATQQFHELCEEEDWRGSFWQVEECEGFGEIPVLVWYPKDAYAMALESRKKEARRNARLKNAGKAGRSMTSLFDMMGREASAVTT
jgi:hypothetical protein